MIDREKESLFNTPDVVLERLGIVDGKRDFAIAMKEHVWGTLGEHGDQPLQMRMLCEFGTEHLENILATKTQLNELTKRIIIALLRERYQNWVIEQEAEILALGREQLNHEENLRILTTVVKAMKNGAERRGDNHLLNQLAGEPSDIAADIIANTKRRPNVIYPE